MQVYLQTPRGTIQKMMETMDTQQSGANMSLLAAKKTDRRIVYTRKVLEQTLVELLHTRPIEKISITELCKRADINRATFYQHFSSPYELLAEIQETFYSSFKADLERLLQKENNTSVLLVLVTKIRDDKELCKVLFSESGERSFHNKTLSIVRDELIRKWEKNHDKVSRAYAPLVFKFITTGSIGMVQEWLMHDCKESPEEITHLLNALCQQGLSGCYPGECG
jgi:AcrR family transcriptional regulator